MTAWGCAAKTRLIRVERAQRAVLKVMHYKPLRYPTCELYSLASVLTVRQLFVLKATLRLHTKLPPPDASKRKPHRACAVPRHKTVFASRQFYVSSSIIYNKINGILDITKLNKHEVKKRLTTWLLKQNYKDTEKLLPNNK